MTSLYFTIAFIRKTMPWLGNYIQISNLNSSFVKHISTWFITTIIPKMAFKEIQVVFLGDAPIPVCGSATDPGVERSTRKICTGTTTPISVVYACIRQFFVKFVFVLVR